MLSIKKSIHRHFALPLRQFFLFVTKITILSLFLLWILYQGISYYHTRFFNQLKGQILQQNTGFQAMIEQKTLESEQEIIALCTDSLQLKMRKRQNNVSIIHQYAEKEGVSILSYQGGKVQHRKESKKELQSYSVQGEQEHIVQFLTLLIQKQYPAYCVSLKLLRQQEKIYVLQMMLKKYTDHETKPLQLEKQAEGLGGE
jgi:hypothetical protein